MSVICKKLVIAFNIDIVNRSLRPLGLLRLLFLGRFPKLDRFITVCFFLRRAATVTFCFTRARFFFILLLFAIDIDLRRLLCFWTQCRTGALRRLLDFDLGCENFLQVLGRLQLLLGRKELTRCTCAAKLRVALLELHHLCLRLLAAHRTAWALRLLHFLSGCRLCLE